MTERKVDMIRVARQEEYYERESIFGRDVASVFPKQATEASASAASRDADALREALGARKFISETELETIKATRGATADDGSAAPLKPLVEVLKEAKERKDADFQNKWKMMKTGKNRPLDPDELAFMDQVLDAEAEKERQARQFEKAELEEFRRALQEAREASPGPAPLIAPPPPKPKVEVKTSAAPKPIIKPAIKVKPKGAPAAGAVKTSAGAETQKSAHGRAADDDVTPAAKKAKVETKEEDDDGSGGGLAGLLGGYDSEDD